jgi:hypothetical protein
MSAEEKHQAIELDDDDFEIDDEEVEVVEEQQSIPQTQQQTSSTDFEALLNQTLEAKLKHHEEQIKTYVDKRIEAVAQRTLANTKEIDALSQRVAGLEKILQTMSNYDNVRINHQMNYHHTDDGVVDKTLGTIGTVLHGAVDATAVILGSVIDVLTLGKAQRR